MHHLDTEPDFDYPGAEHFIKAGRERLISAVKRYLKAHRRGVLLICGDRGAGKTRTLHEILGKKPLFRRTPHIRQPVRRLLPVWIDLSTLGIPSPLLDDLERPIPENLSRDDFDQKPRSVYKLFKRKKFEVTDADFLKAIFQAMAHQLKAHTCFQIKGKGLRTRLRFWEYNFGLRLLWEQIRSKKPFSKEFLFVIAYKIKELLINLFASFIVFLGLSWSLKNIHTLIDPDLIPKIIDSLYIYVQNLPFFLLFIITTIFVYITKRQLRLFAIDLIIGKLHRMSFADEYSLVAEIDQNQKMELKTNPFFGLFSGRKFEKAMFKPTLPYLLRTFDTFLFFIHSFGIEPVLIIDELDKLSIHKDLPYQVLSNPYQRWPDDFRYRYDWDMFIFLDKMVRLKENLFKKIPAIIIADFNMFELIQKSNQTNGPYHTLIQETIVIPIASPVAIKALILRAHCRVTTTCEKDKCDSLMDCNTDLAGYDFTERRLEELSCLIWLESRGLYAKALELIRYYRMKEWRMLKLRKEDLKWAYKAKKALSTISSDWTGLKDEENISYDLPVWFKNLLSLCHSLLKGKEIHVNKATPMDSLDRQTNRYLTRIMESFMAEKIIKLVATNRVRKKVSEDDVSKGKLSEVSSYVYQRPGIKK